jgi:rhodanese-related sulfurtransferase
MMNQGALVLDIRSQDLFGGGHLTGARQMASDKILSAGESLKKYKEKPVLVYCADGSLCAAAVRQLTEQGFTKAFHLRGGLAAWRAENLPLVRG